MHRRVVANSRKAAATAAWVLRLLFALARIPEQAIAVAEEGLVDAGHAIVAQPDEAILEKVAVGAAERLVDEDHARLALRRRHDRRDDGERISVPGRTPLAWARHHLREELRALIEIGDGVEDLVACAGAA